MEVTRPISNILRLPPPLIEDGRPSVRAEDQKSKPSRIEILVEEGENFSASRDKYLAEKEAGKSESADVRKFRNRLETTKHQPTTEASFTAGYPSAPFLAQQIAQIQEEAVQDTAGSEHRDATQAYSDTLGLTAFVVPHSGLNQKVA
ncbi:MAG: hypothetical protein NXI13_10505 [Proteobacteria bacterium]|nr:hypothetical protein [Pseudomonadota bacterium]